MKKIWQAIAAGLIFMTVPVHADEDWKGKADSSEISLGGLTGMGIINNSVGFTVLGTVSKKIVKRGFISDVNNSVSIEGLLGPAFIPAGTAWIYSAHLRWDFVKDDSWTLYAVGGTGGSLLNSSFSLMPRFGIGAFLGLQGGLSVRGEISHDLIAAGVNFRI